ncbi:MAG: DMT family transporter [Euryarchaeota archaeon]|nr:DMT family transporter [Euryarchaeota archaeon]MBU4222991.1 DMT family transporter [Euryarchaeota archaeon]MDP3103138.1 DMT family transporter [Candidatus Methanoperedens sp.]
MISGELYALAAALCWSVAAVFYKKGIGTGAIPAVLIRTFSAMLFVLVMYLIIRGWHFDFTLIGFAFLNLGGLLRLIIGGTAYMKGLENISVSRFIPILFTFPLLTILLSALLLHENIGPEIVAGTVLIVIGVWVLSRGHNTGNEKNVKLGVSFALFAAFLYSFSIVATKTGLNEVDPFQSVLISMPLPLALLYAGYSLKSGPAAIFRYRREAYILLGLGGIAGMGIGSYLFFNSMTLIGAAKATSLAAITPFISSMMAIVTLKEKISLELVFGTAATVAGIWVIM